MKYIAAARYIRQTLQPATERIEFWKFPHADQAYFPINISGKTFILGRYHMCRPLNLTLDIWSNFMKRKKNPFTSIFSCLFLKKGSNSSSFTSFFFILKKEAIFFHSCLYSFASGLVIPQVITQSHGSGLLHQSPDDLWHCRTLLTPTFWSSFAEPQADY